ncbi:hypothetical protein PENSPDRAFT_34902 [Peniophora sp. CONT]|nr:hypothetical protein PENSPDRAFT_34902 [Peniophora sp. CONT]
MACEIWAPFCRVRRLVFGLLSALCLTWTCLYSALTAKGYQGWTSTERAVVMCNLFSCAIAFIMFYLMAVVVFRLWWDFFRAGLLLIILSGASAIFTSFEPSLPCTLGSLRTCRRVYLLILCGSWLITGILVCYCVALAGVTLFAGPFRSFPSLDEEKRVSSATSRAYSISKSTPFRTESQPEPAISPRTQQHYHRIGLTLPPAPRPTRPANLSWYYLEEQALSRSSLRESFSVASTAHLPSYAATRVNHSRLSLHSHPSHPHYAAINAHSTRSLSYSSSLHSSTTEDWRPAIERGAWTQLPRTLSNTSHFQSGLPRAPLSAKRKPVPSLNSISLPPSDPAVQSPPVNGARLPHPVRVIGSGRSVHSLTPSIHKTSASSRQGMISVNPRRRRHPLSLTPGFAGNDLLSRQERPARSDTADMASRNSSMRSIPHDLGFETRL